MQIGSGQSHVVAPARTLVTSFCFPPFSDTAAVVAAKRVREMGEAVDVIYNVMDTVRHRDPSLLRICGDQVRRFAGLRTPTTFASWPAISAFVSEGMAQALAWDDEQGPYEKVYSRAHFAASHFLAAQYKMARPETHWVAEFSDPLSHDVVGKVRRSPVLEGALATRLRDEVRAAGWDLPGDNTLEWAEVLPFVFADELLFTNPNQRDLMLRLCHDPALAEHAASKARVSAHPTLPRSFYHQVLSTYPLAPGRKHIGYFGNFYANRGMTVVLRALRALPQVQRDALTVHVFTGNAGKVAGDDQIASFGESLKVRPYVDYLEFLNLCTTMDCLLVNDATTPPDVGVNPFLPSKISDYKGSGRPVWGIVEPGSRLSMEPLTYVSPTDHVSAAVQVLSQISAS